MNQIVKDSAEYSSKILNEKLPQGCVYHNYTHTLEVVEAAKEIGKNSGLSEDELEIVLISAWFHDTGLSKSYKEHEEESVKICREFLAEKNYPSEKIDKVLRNIQATRIPQNPANKIEAVLCDADLIHIGKKGFNVKTELLRAEWERMLGKSFSDKIWWEGNIEFLSENKFHTEYAKKEFDERRKINLEKVKKRLAKLKNGSDNPAEDNQPPGDFEKELESKKKSEKEKSSKDVNRGIETMFRNTIRTHVEFSGLADNKANIMISVNTLLLTAIIAVLARKLDANPHLILPTAIITVVSLTTLIFATLVTRPKITSGRFTVEDIKQKKTNLLFFGNFFNMDIQHFEWGMREMMKDRDYLYGSMIKDLYYLGQVLGKKYKYLRYCYNIFMYGLILSIIAFTIAIMIHPDVTDLGPFME